MHTIAVTGGVGLVGRYVVQRLLNNEQIAEIRVLDRRAVVEGDDDDEQTTSSSSARRVRSFKIELTDRKAVETALDGVDVVVNCAHSQFPIFYATKKEEIQNMWRDNLDATESVIDVMTSLKIKYLVNVGCAYCPIPNEDNYGLAQDVFLDYPRNYMLDEYGESRTRGEMYARKASQKGILNAVFLRPCFVYGQGKSRKMDALEQLIGSVPNILGDRRGMHQFIFAGNLAGIIEKSIFGLLRNSQKLNAEIVFCMDETCAFPMREFLEKRFGDKFSAQQNGQTYWMAFARSYVNYWRFKLGYEVAEKTLNHVAFRLFFEKSVGFPDKKLRLLLDWKPEINQDKGFEKYVNPKSKYLSIDVTKRTNIQG